MGGFVRNGNVDPLAVIGVFLMAWSILAFHLTFRSHCKKVVDYHLQVLSLRVAVIISIYSIIMFTALLNPHVEPLLEALAVFFEAYSIYNYFALLVVYCGGKDAVIEEIRASQLACCSPCMHDCPGCCFGAIDFGLVQFVVLRPIIILIYGIVYMQYGLTKKAKVLKAIGTILLILAMIGLLRMYRILHAKTAAMGATSKIVIIKILVIFLAVQDLVLQSMENAGYFQSAPGYGLGYSEESKGARVYAFVSLVEFAIASICIGRFFHPDTIAPTDERQRLVGLLKQEPTYCEFVLDFLTFWNVFSAPYRMDALTDNGKMLKDVEMPSENSKTASH